MVNDFFSKSQLNIQSLSVTSEILNEPRNVLIYTKISKQNHLEPLVLYTVDGSLEGNFGILIEAVNIHLQRSIIVVGIENIDRNYDLTPPSTNPSDIKWVAHNGNATKFQAFLHHELIPKITNLLPFQKYKQGFIGVSIAGLFTLQLLFEQPKIFDFFVTIDPSVWWNNNAINKHIKYSSPLLVKNKTLYIATSNVKNISTGVDQLLFLIKKNDLIFFKLIRKSFPQYNHHQIFRGIISDIVHFIENI